MLIKKYLLDKINSVITNKHSAVEYDDHDFVIIVIDKPAPSDDRPNKRSAQLIFKFSRELIEDYFGGFNVNSIKWDENILEQFLTNKITNALNADDLFSLHGRDETPRKVCIVITEIQ